MSDRTNLKRVLRQTNSNSNTIRLRLNIWWTDDEFERALLVLCDLLDLSVQSNDSAVVLLESRRVKAGEGSYFVRHVEILAEIVADSGEAGVWPDFDCFTPGTGLR